MRDVSIGQYYPAKSAVHRLDARTKIILVIAYIVMLFFVPTLNKYDGNVFSYMAGVGGGGVFWRRVMYRCLFF